MLLEKPHFKAQVPSSSCLASARGLARLAAFMANKGTLGGKRLMGIGAWNAVHAEPQTAYDVMTCNPETFTAGGVSKWGYSELAK